MKLAVYKPPLAKPYNETPRPASMYEYKSYYKGTARRRGKDYVDQELKDRMSARHAKGCKSDSISRKSTPIIHSWYEDPGFMKTESDAAYDKKHHKPKIIKIPKKWIEFVDWYESLPMCYKAKSYHLLDYLLTLEAIETREYLNRNNKGADYGG